MVVNSRRTVLVIEDNDLNREILCEILSPTYNVLQAENGKVGLEILTEKRLDISLILLDIQMPVMDGHEFLAVVSSKPHFSNIPIIVTTSSASATDEIRCLDEGASDFVSKPYNNDIVLKRVGSMIRLSEASAVINRMEYDALTGLYSKEFFYINTERALRADPDGDFDILCTDIKSFKMINDRYGAKRSDQLLSYIADNIRGLLPGSSLFGRISGDVFAVLTRHQDKSVYEKVISELSLSMKQSPVQSAIVQAGLYQHIDTRQPVSVSCDNAIIAIEGIKQYRASLAEYNENVRHKLIREQILLDTIGSAGDMNEQFFVYYQPKYSFEHQKVMGAEALIRWIHPEMGFLSPGEFIPLFEVNGFIELCDLYMLEKVCSDLRGWIDAGKKVFPISLNLSRVDFANLELVKTVAQIVSTYDIPHELIHFEITESAYTENMPLVLSSVEELRKNGFKIELDDFGAGYSSLNILNDMHLDILKLDMSLVRNINSERQMLILKHVIKIAHGLDMQVVAEGVETPEQAEKLKAMGCTYGQGYLYSKPIPKEQFEVYLNS